MRVLHVLLIKGEDIIFTQPDAEVLVTSVPRETIVMGRDGKLATYRPEFVIGWHYEDKEAEKEGGKKDA